MKQTCKRITALLLTVFLLISLIATLSLSTGAASYSYNSGKRGTVCTALSTSAKSYYTSGYDWATLSVLSGSALNTKLCTKMTTGYSATSYDGLKTLFKYSDANQGSSGKMNYLYSGIAGTSSWDSGKSWNREHVWPQSLGTFTTATNTAGADILHLRPSDSTMNSTRGNKPFGEVTNGTYTSVYTKTGVLGGYINAGFFEPLDSAKGDIARILLYVYTRWNEGPLTKVIQNTDLLLKWCELDPVDAFEMSRNDICEQITNSRNVYVDYPEYCWLVLGEKVPTHMTTPSGKAKICSNPDYVSSITTAATCTTNGVKTFTCKNCGYSYTEVIYATGHHYVNGTCEFCGKAQPTGAQYVEAATIKSGDKVVIYSTNGRCVISSTPKVYKERDELSAAAATVAGKELTITGSNPAIFTVSTNSKGQYAFKNADGKFLTCLQAEYLSLESTATAPSYWILEDSGSSSWYLKNSTTVYKDYTEKPEYLEYYGGAFTTYGFQASSAAAFDMKFYSYTAPCSHSYVENITSPATCTETGSATYVCSLCGDRYTRTLSALDHDWNMGTVTSAATSPTHIGTKLYTCNRCNATKTESYTTPCAITDYLDIEQTDWFHAAADYVIDHKMMGSTKTDYLTFEPETNMSRAMLVMVLYRIEGNKKVENPSKSFTDVPEGQWYTDAVIWAAENNIVSGTGDGTTFSPNDNITREQIALILYNYCKNYKKLDVSKTDTLGAFIDAGSVSSWALTGVQWAVAEKLISGRSLNSVVTLAPGGNAMRCELAAVMMNFERIVPATDE